MGLVPFLVYVPLALWTVTEAWHRPILIWLARHPWRAIAGLGHGLRWVPVAASTLIAAPIILAAWWLTSPPAPAEATDRWRWPLVRWGFFAIVLGYPLLWMIVNLAVAWGGEIKEPMLVPVSQGLSIEILFAMAIYLIVTELGDMVAQILCLLLIGVAIVEQLSVSIAGEPSTVRGATFATVLLLSRSGVSIYLLWRLGWPRSEKQSLPGATEEPRAPSAAETPSLQP